jgi:hypothetical protein
MAEAVEREIKVHIVGGPEDGRDKTIAIPGKGKPRRVRLEGIEYLLVQGKHKMTHEDNAKPVTTTLCVHPHAAKLFAEPA